MPKRVIHIRKGDKFRTLTGTNGGSGSNQYTNYGVDGVRPLKKATPKPPPKVILGALPGILGLRSDAKNLTLFQKQQFAYQRKLLQSLTRKSKTTPHGTPNLPADFDYLNPADLAAYAAMLDAQSALAQTPRPAPPITTELENPSLTLGPTAQSVVKDLVNPATYTYAKRGRHGSRK